MAVLLQVEFKMDGPFGDEMAEQFADLAESINEEEGFIRKIWTEKAEDQEAGGIYIFDTQENAEKYLEMHEERLKEMGVPDLRAKIFDINDKLTEITKGLV
jgi:quinol monooxygenase YgiN